MIKLIGDSKPVQQIQGLQAVASSTFLCSGLSQLVRLPSTPLQSGTLTVSLEPPITCV